MKLTGKNKNPNKSLIFIIALIWSLIVLFNYLYETKGIRDNTVTLALTEARNSFMNNVIYRKWESLEGGVYVKVSEYTPPNPYLDVKDRDVVTTDGVKLTLVNPAYMTRMVHELQKGKNGIQGHITSLNPIRPENSADAWEKKALRRFEKGTKEFSSFEYINNKKFLRFMSPFITESECLKCHAKQGYKVGDIRGGISISLPYDKYENIISRHTDGEQIQSLILLLVGLSCMFIFTKFSDKFLRKIELEKDKIDRILKSTPNAIIIHKDDKILYANKSAFHLFNVDESFDINSVSISDIVHKDFAEISKQMIANVVDKNLHAKTANLKIVCFDGVIKDIESTAIPFDFNGEKSVLVIAKDITQLLFLENQLKHSEEQFRLIFESSPLAISVTSINDGKYSAVNKVFEKISGYSRDEIIGKTSTELGFWLTEQERNNFVKKLVENEFIDEIEIKFKVRNGNKIYCLVTSRLIKIASENYILSLIEDITNKKYLQDISKKEDLRAKILFEIYSKASELNEKDFFSLVIDKAVELTDSKIGFFHKVNDDQGTIELVTWSLELRQNCSPVFDSHYPISQAGNWVDCIKKGETLTYNDYDKLPNKKGFPEGHVGLTRFMSVPAFLNGKVKLIFGVGNKDAEYNEFDEKNLGIIANELTKILEKKTLNEALKKSENELRGLFNANSTYIIKTDMEGKYTFYNQKFKKTFDWLFNGNDFYGINSLETIYHEDHPKCLEVVERCIQNPETTFQVELRKPKQGDKQMTTLWEFTCKLGSNNQPEEMLCVGLDITEKKNAELKLDEYRKNLERMVEERTEELKRTNQGLETQIEKEKELKAQLAEALSKEKELNELKTRFVASVSHEFRTPLAALLSSSQIIQKYSQKWNEEKLNVHYQKIENMVNHLTQLLDEVITISRADREVIKNIPSKEVIDQVINSIIQIEKQNLKKGQKIIYKNECDKEIYSIDIKLFDHILSNLLSNASKYSPEVSKIILSVQSDAGNLIIKVKDEGIGIPADEIKNIYEPFYRNENSIGFKGSGLGLNIVKRCIDILNGKIEVESEINKGTIFSVLIPVE